MRRLLRIIGTICVLFWLGLAVLYFGWTWINDQRAEKWVATGVPLIGRFVMADRTIAKGELIKAQDVVEMPSLPEGIPDDALLCKDSIIGKTASDEIKKGWVVTAGALVDGKSEFEKQMDKFHQNGNNPAALCSHNYGSFWNDDGSQSLVWLVKSDDGVPEGQVYKLEDFEARNKNEIKVKVGDAVQNCWMFVGRVCKYGLVQGNVVKYFEVDSADKGFKTTKLVTTKDIEAGEPVDIKQLKKVEVDCSDLPIDAVTDEKIIDDWVVAHVKLPAGVVVRAPDLDVSEKGLKEREKLNKEEQEEANKAIEESEKGQ